MAACEGTIGLGHESLSVLVHFVPNPLSVRYPASRFSFFVKKKTSLRLSNPDEKHTDAFLLGHNIKHAPECVFYVVPKTGFEPACP
jgi:hypothetical protein